MNLNSSNQNHSPSHEVRTVDCRLPTVDFPSLAPTEQEVALLTTQYRKAVNGLYEAYRFGQMLAQVKARLEAALGDAARGTAEISHGDRAIVGGWNAGTGLRGWLAEHCPEINYSTARRFLQVAEKTHAALSSGDSPVDCSLSTVDSAAEPSEQAVRDFLEGKSQRAVLRLGGKREGAGRKPKDWAAALGTSPEVAMKRLEEALVPLNELIVVKALHRLLAPADLETVRGAIDLLRERIWENA